MAVSDHLKVASTELRKAADLVKQEIENLRHQETQMQRDLEAQVANRLRLMQTLEHDRRVADNSQITSQIRAQIARVEREVAEIRVQIRDQQRNIQNAIQQKNGMVTGLEMQARTIIS